MKGFKVIRKDMTHNGFKYQRGLNVDTNRFRRTGSCVEGGLYFFTNLKDLTNWLDYGDHLWEVQVPEGAQCVQDPDGDKYRADKLVLVKRHSLTSKNIWKQIAKHVDATAIYWAARRGHLEVVKALIEYKAPVNEAAIWAAAISSHLEIVKELIAYKAPVDEYAIYEAALYGHPDIVKVLIDYKAPVNEYAIYWASRNGHLEIVKELIKYKAPVDEWAIYGASREGHLDIVNVLLEYKAPVHENAIRYAATEEIREVLKEYMKQ